MLLLSFNLKLRLFSFTGPVCAIGVTHCISLLFFFFAARLHISQLYLILQLDLILHQFCMVFFIFGLSKERYQYL